MLLFMTFNVWICAATVVGEVSARLIFAVVSGQNQIIKAVSYFCLMEKSEEFQKMKMFGSKFSC